MANTQKLFRRESGEMQAVTRESRRILEITKKVIEKVKSDPPPGLKKALPPGAGLYKATPDPETIKLPVQAAAPVSTKTPESKPEEAEQESSSETPKE